MIGIREMHPGEEAICAAIFNRAWNTAMPHRPRLVTVEQFLIETEGERVFVATGEAGISGFISIWMIDAFVHHLYVDPSSQRHGIGAELLAHAARITEGMELSLKCLVDNGNALRFYRALGFVESNDRGEDELGRWVRLRQPRR